MENIEYVLSLAVSAAGLLITALTFMFKFIKNEKAKKLGEWMIKVTSEIILLVEKAEKFNEFSGKEKKDFVTKKAQEYADEHRIPLSEEFISDKIEEIIKTTKQVNTKKH